MAVALCYSSPTTPTLKFCIPFPFPSNSPFFPISVSFPNPNYSSTSTIIFCRRAAKTDPPPPPVNGNKKQKHKHKHHSPPNPSSSSKKNKKKKSVVLGADDEDSQSLNSNDFEVVQDEDINITLQNASLHYPQNIPLPEPPTGFVLQDNGRVLLTPSNRLATIVDPTNNLPLECVIRRVFTSSERVQCMLLCPLDTPIQVLKSTLDGWSAIKDEEVDSILPAAAYALAKIHMHLVHSGYCYTARGGFCYTEQDIIDFHTDDGEEVDGLPSDGVEITYFNLDGARYMIYTPSDPLSFVAVKGENGMFQIADDDLLDDPAVMDAIDEETEFNALVEEEAAFIKAMVDES